MVKKGVKQTKRNGKLYVSAWIDEKVVVEAKKEAKKDRRTFASYIEMALSNHNDFWENNPIPAKEYIQKLKK
jgi:hypothetical protein